MWDTKIHLGKYNITTLFLSCFYFKPMSWISSATVKKKWTLGGKKTLQTENVFFFLYIGVWHKEVWYFPGNILKSNYSSCTEKMCSSVVSLESTSSNPHQTAEAAGWRVEQQWEEQQQKRHKFDAARNSRSWITRSHFENSTRQLSLLYILEEAFNLIPDGFFFHFFPPSFFCFQVAFKDKWQPN